MESIKDIVQQKYGKAALEARAGHKADCGCSTSCCSTITSNLYDEAQAEALPAEAMLASQLMSMTRPDVPDVVGDVTTVVPCVPL